MRKNLLLPRGAMDRLRNVLLQRQLKTAYQQVPFYRSLFEEAKVSPFEIKTVADLHRIPIITKKDIRQHQQWILNRKYQKARCYRSHTSGSTGEPTWTYFDRHCWYRKKYFSKLRARMACGMKWGEKVVILESETTRELRIKNRKFSNLFFLFPVTYLSIFEHTGRLLNRLIELQPHNVYGPPSSLFVLSQKAKQVRKNVRSLKRIFTSSEYLAHPIKHNIEKSLRAKVYDIYGSTETKEIAWQCSRADGYHINEDEVIVEIVDEKGMVLPPGSPGNIVITDLQNQAMPLIRYRNQDQGLLLKEPCSCGFGFSLMKPLSGRASEHICLPNGRCISPFLFTTSIEKTKGLLQYKIIQERSDSIKVKTIFEKGLFKHGSNAIRSILLGVTENLMTIEIENCDNIDIEKNGKFMVVETDINHERSPKHHC